MTKPYTTSIHLTLRTLLVQGHRGSVVPRSAGVVVAAAETALLLAPSEEDTSTSQVHVIFTFLLLLARRGRKKVGVQK